MKGLKLHYQDEHGLDITFRHSDPDLTVGQWVESFIEPIILCSGYSHKQVAQKLAERTALCEFLKFEANTDD